NQYTFNYKDIDNLENILLKQLDKDIKKLIISNHTIVDLVQARSNASIDDIVSSKEKRHIYLKQNMNLPRRDINFVGRELEIDFILKTLIDKNECAITGVVGTGGIGKSAITAEITHIIKDSWRGEYGKYLKQPIFEDGILWIKLEREQTIKQVYEEQVIKQLGIKLDINSFESELNTLLFEKKILVVIDSVEQNFIIFFELTDLFRNFALLATSRARLDGIYEFSLNTLNKEDSLELFKKYLGRAIDNEEKKGIENFCIETLGGLPLTIKIVANYMKKTQRTLSEVQMNVNFLELEIQDMWKKEYISTFAVFELSYSNLSKEAQLVFAIASVFSYPFKEKYLLEIVNGHKKRESITNEIDELIQISFIDKDVNEGVYSFHPLLREFALNKLNEFQLNEVILEALKKHYLALSEQKTNLPDIYEELFVIIEDDYRKKNYERFFKIIKNLDWWLVTNGFYSRRESLLKKGYEKAKELQDKDNEYYFLRNYGDALSRRGETKKAKEQFEKVVKFKNAEEDFWLHYRLISEEYTLGSIETSYSKNLQWSRKALQFNKLDYGSFLKTNSWISSDLSKLHLSVKFAQASSFVEKMRSNCFKSLSDFI
ncbi:MAG: NB-ARC domain-containing protein, partial [Campylobacterota bacterium]|nr:NB-ARC domain-containing protein [Campylobacterota bacterium]